MPKISSTGLDVYPLALGGNVFGWTANEKESYAVLDAYVAAGGNFVDTADVYSAWAPGNSGGESETILGKWLEQRKLRDRMIIATKVGMHSQLKGLSARTILSAAENSLKRLRTDYIDLYYAHIDDENTALEVLLLFFLLFEVGAGGFGGGDDFFLLERRDEVVVVHLHVEGAAALGHGGEVGAVAEHLR
jgi:aryl-alcohol dehydrogenase-like predicted oxidoreductase